MADTTQQSTPTVPTALEPKEKPTKCPMRTCQRQAMDGDILCEDHGLGLPGKRRRFYHQRKAAVVHAQRRNLSTLVAKLQAFVLSAQNQLWKGVKHVQNIWLFVARDIKTAQLPVSVSTAQIQVIKNEMREDASEHLLNPKVLQSKDEETRRKESTTDSISTHIEVEMTSTPVSQNIEDLSASNELPGSCIPEISFEEKEAAQVMMSIYSQFNN
ncbi:hypothetical protein F4814DRAFT_445078 [Daldinia grandis]|nr:hypothetical protein F4814DRAFT_445078 [Daldinia grandis]